MTEAILVLCTCPSEGVANLLASQLVDQRLAACVNVIPAIQSIYCGQQKVEQSEECQLLIKSRRELFEPLRLFLREHHPYEVPELLVVEVAEAGEAYLHWLNQSVSANGSSDESAGPVHAGDGS